MPGASLSVENAAKEAAIATNAALERHRARLSARSAYLSRAVEHDPALLVAAVHALSTCHRKDEVTQRAEALGAVHGFIGPAAMRALRVRKRVETLRIVLAEAETRDIATAYEELSDLAAGLISAAVDVATREHEANRGPAPCGFAVMGMGKLGSRELNLSSDVDLIFVYDADPDEDTEGRTFRWFRRLCERLVALLSEVTADGFVYRVDLGLRPEGQTGPICNALDALERYYEAWGHGWERVAWLRARPVAGDVALGARLLKALQPFTYRRFLDPKAIDEIRAMKAQIDARARSRADAARDVKLGPGGIREIEFFAQALQLVYGGPLPALRVRGTLAAVDRLVAAGLVGEDDGRVLNEGYLFLRSVEHQLQLVEDRQTQTLPSDPEALSFVATALGYAERGAFEADLDTRRAAVSALWAELFSGGDPVATEPMLDEAQDQQLRRLEAIPKSPFHPRHAVTGVALRRAILHAASEAAEPAQALALFGDLVARPRIADPLLAFLETHPTRARLLLHLLGSSRLLGGRLVNDATLLEDLVLGPTAGLPAPQALPARFAVTDPDLETAWEDLRARQHREVVRIAVADLAGQLDVNAVGRALTAVADAAVQTVVARVLSDLDLGPDSLAVVALGSLGAQALLYASDLDLLFVGDASADAALLAKACQRILRGLTLDMRNGRLWDVDLRLRPSGHHGPLLVTWESLARYQLTEAAPWEHLALTRARVVAGTADHATRLARTVCAVIELPRDPAAIRAEVHRIQERVLAEATPSDPAVIDLKLGRGGSAMLKVMVATLRVLDGGRRIPPGARPTRALLPELVEAGMLGRVESEALGEALDHLHRAESRLRLRFDRPAHVLQRGSDASDRLAHALGFHDVPGRPGRVRFEETTDRLRDAVALAFGRHVGG